MTVLLTVLAWVFAALCLVMALFAWAACRLSGILSEQEEAHLTRLQQGEQQ